MGKKIEVEIVEHDGIYLREHVGDGEATAPNDGRKFTMSRGLGLPTLFVDVEEPDGKAIRRYMVTVGREVVEAILEYDRELREDDI